MGPLPGARGTRGDSRVLRGMKRRGCRRMSHFSVVAAIALICTTGCSRPLDENALAQHRSLGKAFYENPTTKQEAVREFQQAFKIAPGSTRDKLNYALALLRVEGREPEAGCSSVRRARTG